jgi:hypothetical protein
MNRAGKASIHGSWQQYVATQCIEAWDLDVEATRRVLAKIEALVTARVLTMPAVALVLSRAGITESAADRIAPSILAAIAG